MAERLTLAGAPEGYDAWLLARARAEYTGPILHVCRDDARMARMAEALGFFAPEVEVLQFPAWDCLPYDRVGPNPELTARRIDTLTRLLVPPGGPRIVLTTVNALVQRVPVPEAFAGAVLPLARGTRIGLDRIVAFLEANGYGRANTVIEPGEYAVRGGLIDLFPAGREEPVRIDLFGDEIDSIRSFDPFSQRSASLSSSSSSMGQQRGQIPASFTRGPLQTKQESVRTDCWTIRRVLRAVGSSHLGIASLFQRSTCPVYLRRSAWRE